MRSAMLGLAVAIVRAWTRVYTWRMEPMLREARRREIESDLWEFRQDSTLDRGLIPAAHILLRLLIGMPDDLRWRVAHSSAGDKLLRKTIAVSAAAAVLFLATLWVFASVVRVELPQPPEPPTVRWTPIRPAEPPPPPPPPPYAPARGR